MKIISPLGASVVILPNQLTLVLVLGNGERGLESKAVADWYRRANVK